MCVLTLWEREWDGPTSRHKTTDRERGAEEETEGISVCVEVWLPYLTNELVLTQRKSELIVATLDPGANTNSVWQLHIHWLPPSTPTLFINSIALSVRMSFCVCVCVHLAKKKCTEPCHLSLSFIVKRVAEWKWHLLTGHSDINLYYFKQVCLSTCIHMWILIYEHLSYWLFHKKRERESVSSSSPPAGSHY